MIREPEIRASGYRLWYDDETGKAWVQIPDPNGGQKVHEFSNYTEAEEFLEDHANGLQWVAPDISELLLESIRDWYS